VPAIIDAVAAETGMTVRAVTVAVIPACDQRFAELAREEVANTVEIQTMSRGVRVSREAGGE